MANNKISNTLYSFMALRVPEKAYRYSDAAPTVITYPSYNESQLVNVTDPADFQDFVDSFSATALVDLKTINPGILKLGTALFNDKKHFNLDELLVAKSGLTALSTAELSQIWDNYFYHTALNKRFSEERKVCEWYIRVQFILDYIKAGLNENEVSSILSAKIALPSLYFSKAENTKVKSPSVFRNNTTQKVFSSIKAVLNAEMRLPVLIELGKKAELAKSEYWRAEETRKAAYELTHQKAVEDWLADLKAQYPEPNKYLEAYNSTPPPPYTYFSEMLEYLFDDNLSASEELLVKELDLNGNGGFEPVLNKIQLEIRKTETFLFKAKLPQTKSYKVHKGIVLPKDNNVLEPINLYEYDCCPIITGQDVSFNLVFTLGGSREIPAHLDFELLNDTNSVLLGNSTNFYASAQGGFGIHFPSQSIAIPDNPYNLILRIKLTTSTNEVYEFAISLNDLKQCFSGSFAPPVVIANPRTVYGVTRLGIADYRKVEQYICCYVPGEVSHIENLMAREIKERTTSRLRREENTLTTETSSESEKMTDTTSTERHEMNQELAKMSQESFDFGVNAGINVIGTGYTANISTDLAYHTSSEESQTASVNEAKERTMRAMERIVTKSREEKIRKVIEEYSEQNTHGFDNRQGDRHISGVYRWVDKVYKHEIHNYGKRLMYEFMIPEPARLHHLALQNATSNVADLSEPMSPQTILSTGLLPFNEQNYLAYAEYYDIEIEAPPALYKTLGKAYSGGSSNGAAKYEWNDLKIPEGYKLIEVKGTIRGQNSGNTNMLIVMNVANQIANFGNTYSVFDFLYPTSYTEMVNGSSQLVFKYLDEMNLETIPVSVVTWDIGAFALNVMAKTERLPETLANWQSKAWSKVIAGYEAKLRTYKDALDSAKAEEAQNRTTNPLFYRDIEKTILRKHCIEYILAQGQSMGLNFQNSNNNFAHHAIVRNQNLEDYAALVKFVEQAFEWDLISYQFYPFYWADKNRWTELYNTEVDDKLFTKFLQSGMGRVIATVRPGFEKAVNWYMATGEIWNGGEAPLIDDELYLAIDEELQNPEYVLEGTWEVKVPSSLTLIQAGVVALNAEGLPCMDSCAEHNGWGIEQLPDTVLGNLDTIVEG